MATTTPLTTPTTIITSAQFDCIYDNHREARRAEFAQFSARTPRDYARLIDLADRCGHVLIGADHALLMEIVEHLRPEDMDSEFGIGHTLLTLNKNLFLHMPMPVVLAYIDDKADVYADLPASLRHHPEVLECVLAQYDPDHEYHGPRIVLPHKVISARLDEYIRFGPRLYPLLLDYYHQRLWRDNPCMDILGRYNARCEHMRRRLHASSSALRLYLECWPQDALVRLRLSAWQRLCVAPCVRLFLYVHARHILRDIGLPLYAEAQREFQDHIVDMVRNTPDAVFADLNRDKPEPMQT